MCSISKNRTKTHRSPHGRITPKREAGDCGFREARVGRAEGHRCGHRALQEILSPSVPNGEFESRPSSSSALFIGVPFAEPFYVEADNTRLVQM